LAFHHHFDHRREKEYFHRPLIVDADDVDECVEDEKDG